MSDAITRCPKCHTSFKVTQDILNSARGSVRCGSCLMIFNAKENLISGNEEEQQIPSPAHAEEQADEELIHDDARLESDDGELIGADEEFDANVFVAGHASKSDINLFERRIKEEDKRDLENADTDESWALSLLENDDEEDAATSEPEPIPESRPSPFQIIEEEEPDTYHEYDENHFDENVFSSNNERSDAELAYEDGHSEQSFEFEDEVEPSLYGNSRTDFLDAIEPEPLELTVPYKPPIWHRNGFWLGLSSLALALLVFQLAYFNFDNFSRKQALRPYYQQACELLGCHLPVLSDFNQLKVQNMVVMDHPELNEMLLVDATLINHANFEQAFPTLQITFTDIANSVVSKMLFDPASYVGGELSGKRTMPSKHPIHISLELADPGAEALNYQIAIVKP